METLTLLKAASYKIGLISNCSAEVPLLWQDTPFASLVDFHIFSCKVGLRKPDPRIYRLACELLAVEPHSCLYVGDGDQGELAGASQAGMQAVLLRVPYPEDTYGLAYDHQEAEEWQGPAISALKDVLALVED